MRIATMIQGNSADFENRKKVLARKEMDNAYKKHAKYAEANKNPMLATLENLLSGKTDKEVHAADQAIKEELKQLTATEQDVLTDGAAGAGVTGVVSYTHTIGPNQYYIADGEVSSQAPPTAQVQDTPGKVVNEESLEGESDVEPYANEDVSFNVPERFQTSVQRDPEASTLFGKDLEQLIFKRTFNKATEKYMSHVAMVRNSYRSYNEPQYIINA